MKYFSMLVVASIVATLMSTHACAEVIRGSLEVDGLQRTWRLFLPSTYNENVKHALVLDFHGTGGTPEGQSANSGFTKLAAEKDFLVVNPAGKYRRSADGGLTWNVDLDPAGINDVRFIRALIEHLQHHYAIDAARIYSTGFSGGARMSSRLACDLSDQIAAIGAVGGLRFPEKCAPTHPVAIMAIHSEDDEVNHFNHRADSPAYWPVGVNEALSGWAKYNKCNESPNESRVSQGVTKLEYLKCSPGAAVVLIKLVDGGHTWPGSPTAKRAPTENKQLADFAATEKIWEFFEHHSRH